MDSPWSVWLLMKMHLILVDVVFWPSRKMNSKLPNIRELMLDVPLGQTLFFPCVYFFPWVVWLEVEKNPQKSVAYYLFRNLTKNMMDSPRRSPVNVIVLDSSWWTWLPNSFIVLWTKLVLKIALTWN